MLTCIWMYSVMESIFALSISFRLRILCHYCKTWQLFNYRYDKQWLLTFKGLHYMNVCNHCSSHYPYWHFESDCIQRQNMTYLSVPTTQTKKNHSDSDSTVRNVTLCLLCVWTCDQLSSCFSGILTATKCCPLAPVSMASCWVKLWGTTVQQTQRNRELQ